MAQNRLNGLIRNSLIMQVGCKSPPECVPAVPFNTCFLEGGQDFPSEHVVQAHGLTHSRTGEHGATYGISEVSTVADEFSRQAGNHRHGSRAGRGFWLQLLPIPAGA